VPQGPLESFVGSYVSLEGVVCRKFESKGNLFVSIKGDYEVEVPIFFGLKDSLEKVPDLGDWISVNGILEEVPQEYLREHWPKLSLSVNEPHEIVVGEVHHIFLEDAYEYCLFNAGRVLNLSGKIDLIENGEAFVGGVGITLTNDMMIADEVVGKALIVENDHRLENIPIKLEVKSGKIAKIADIRSIGEAYLAKGRIIDMRPYYSGLLMNISDGENSIEVYSKSIPEVFFGDEITARGIFKEYRGKDLLYVTGARDTDIVNKGELDDLLDLTLGNRIKAHAVVREEILVGRHRILTLEVLGEELQCHLYQDEIENMERMGRSMALLSKGKEIVVYLEIIDYKGTLESKLIDFLPFS